MAIIVQEEKQGGGIWNILSWLVILGLVIGALYYIFFLEPQSVEFLVPNFKNTQELSQIQLSPETVINSPAFQALNQYITLSSSTSLGRANPFLSF